jgi:Xaa-Pro aminopeptidase
MNKTKKGSISQLEEKAMSVLTREERDRRWKKVRDAMKKRGFECLVVWGSTGGFGGLAANLRYLSNTTEQGYLVFPLEGEPTIFTFEKGLETPWVPDSRVGQPSYSKAISERIKESDFEKVKIGIVGLSGYFGEMGFPYTSYKTLMDTFPKAIFEDATDLLQKVRLIKSAAEVRCFELACEVGSKVMQAVVDTAKAGVKDYEVIAKIMDTLYRSGCEPCSMILYHSGKEAVHAADGGWLQPPSLRVLELGDVILIEFDAKYYGYRAQYNQPFSVGKPNKEWQELFNVALESHNIGMKALKPGITAGELDNVFLTPIRKARYKMRNPAFHGLGLGLEAPMGSFPGQPDYKPDPSFLIEAGMVIELEPHVVSQDERKGIHLGSPVLVTETGCRLLTKDWKPEFKIT